MMKKDSNKGNKVAKGLTVTYSSKDLMDKLAEQDKTLAKILNHAQLTNGRVTKLEKTSFGMWCREHPIKFATYIVVLMATLVSDLRHPIFKFLMGMIGL